MHLNILVLPGDGIGEQVTRQAVKVLRHVAARFPHTLHLTEGLLGGVAIHKTGGPLPEETLQLALEVGIATADLRPAGPPATTGQVGQAVTERIV